MLIISIAKGKLYFPIININLWRGIHYWYGPPSSLIFINHDSRFEMYDYVFFSIKNRLHSEMNPLNAIIFHLGKQPAVLDPT